MFNKVILILVGIFLSVNILPIEISKVDTITIDQEKVILQRIINFSVTEEGYFLFPDQKAGDIKIYNKKGFLLKILGRKGMGPDEYVSPMCSNYKKPYFTFMDWGKRKLFILKKEDGLTFKKVSEEFIQALAYDLKFINENKILVSGYKADSEGQEYDLYFYNPQTSNADFLLPSFTKFGYSTQREYKNNYLSSIAPLNISGYCEYFSKNIYFVWTGNLKILKMDSTTRKVSHFGLKTKNYIQPVVTPRLLKLYNERSKELSAEMQKISYVTGLFADDDFVGVTYANYIKNLEGWQTIVQFYNHDGKFLKEIVLPGAINTTQFADPSFCYVSEGKTFYYLARTMDEEFNDIFKIITFKITP